MQTIQPANNQVFAEVIKEENQTKSGIIIARANEAKTNTAHVINVGKNIDWLNAKDTIVYKLYATTDIKLNDKEYILIAEEDILGKVVEV